MVIIRLYVRTPSSVASFLAFQVNSQQAVIQASANPPTMTTKTPPTLSRPSSAALAGSSSSSACHTNVPSQLHYGSAHVPRASRNLDRFNRIQNSLG